MDAQWYIDYALSAFHESRFPAGRVEIVPLHPLWLNLWMNVDADYVDDLHCLRDNLPHWHGGRFFDDGDITACRQLDNIGFRVQVLAGGIGIGLVWLAGWLVSGRPMAAHLAAAFAVYARGFIKHGNTHEPESLVVPLLAGVNVCLAVLVLGSTKEKRRRTVAVAAACGLLLGALALTRPPYEFLLAALPLAAAVWMLRDRPRRREIVVAAACIVMTASLVVTPWIVRNHVQKHFVGLVQGYGPEILIERLAFNAMTWRQWIAAFLVWSDADWGPDRAVRRLATELFGAETVAPLTYRNPDYYGRRAEEILNVEWANVAREDRLGFLLGRVWSDLPKHLAVSVPLAWRGMAQHEEIPFGSACWLLVLFGFVRGSPRNRSALAALAFCPVVILAVNAFVSTGLPRYSFGLLTPLSVGVALPVAWAVDGVWNRLRRLIPRVMPHDPNRSTDSRRRS